MKPYGILSDLHCHLWSSFSTTTPQGINSRLALIIAEFERCAQTVKAAGGKFLVIAGDIFHVRGAVDPEVLNPLQQALRRVLDLGLDVYLMPGNHDLKSKETTVLGNGIQTLGETFSQDGAAFMITEPKIIGIEPGHAIGFVPWMSSRDELLETLKELADSVADPGTVDMFIHAGIDGVLRGMPDHGLTAAMLAKFGFRRVFAGHYHNHHDFGNFVYSIGATTHQTWGDIGTKAGFLVVEDPKSRSSVRYHASHAPSFVEINEDTDQNDVPLIVDGNYVRVRGGTMSDSDIKSLRTELEGMNAFGVSIQVVRETVSARGSTPAAKGQTVDQSVDKYIDDKKIDEADQVKAACQDVLSHVRSIAA